MSKDETSKGVTKAVLLQPTSVPQTEPERSQPQPEPQPQPQPEPQPQPQPEQRPEQVLDFQESWEAFDHFHERSDAWYSALPQTQRKALSSYTGSGFDDLNTALRDEGKFGTPLSEHHAKMKKSLNAALGKFDISESIVLYRGASYACIPKFARKDPSKLIGKTYFDNGFMSCGASRDAGWDREVRFVITLPKGSKGAGAYVGEHSSCPHEGEFLLRSNCHFTVTDASKGGDGVITVNMTLIPGKFNLVSKA